MDFTIRDEVDPTTRTHYTEPTFAQIEGEVNDLMLRLNMFAGTLERREALAQAVVDALPYRVVRRAMGLGPDLVAEVAP